MLETLLAGAKEQMAKVTEMMVCIPPELPEYTELLDREGKLDCLIKQVNLQISIRK